MNEKVIYKVTFRLNWECPRLSENYFLAFDIESVFTLAWKYIKHRIKTFPDWKDATILSIEFLGRIEDENDFSS